MAKASLAVVVVATLSLTVCYDIGYMLWPTALAFWFGVYSARYPIQGGHLTWMTVGVISASAFIVASLAGFKAVSLLFLIATSISAVLWTERVAIPRRPTKWLLAFVPMLLEIYLIHTYLFFDLGLPRSIQFIASLAATVFCAMLLSKISERLRRAVFARSAHP